MYVDMNMRARVHAGDPDAFRELFNEHVRSVYNHAFRLTYDWSAAEDVVSLTFLEAWRLRDRVGADGGSLRPWLLGIATNVARNIRRASRRYDGALARLPKGRSGCRTSLKRPLPASMIANGLTRFVWRWRPCVGPSVRYWCCAHGLASTTPRLRRLSVFLSAHAKRISLSPETERNSTEGVAPASSPSGPTSFPSRPPQ